jgi:Holliday junction resolvase
MAKKNPETAIRRQVQEYLRWQGWFIYHNLAGLGSYPGLSDLVAIKSGKVVHIEVKTPTGKLSEYQQKFRDDVEAHGGEYLVARKVEDVQGLEYLGDGNLILREGGE